MVSWGPSREDGSKFYKGMKEEPPWVQDLNWSNRCKLENKKLMKRKMMQESMRKTNTLSVPPFGVAMGKQATQKEIEDYVKGRDGGGGTQRSSGSNRTARKSTGRRTQRTGRTARSTARTSARSSFSTGRSSIGTINTDMKDLIRETAENELKQLRQALENEATLRAASDQKIDLLLKELQALKK
jgi:hypothetical protein